MWDWIVEVLDLWFPQSAIGGSIARAIDHMLL